MRLFGLGELNVMGGWSRVPALAGNDFVMVSLCAWGLTASGIWGPFCGETHVPRPQAAPRRFPQCDPS